MLVIFEAIGNIIGFGYLIGSLKETFDWADAYWSFTSYLSLFQSFFNLIMID